jgi:hypothetical protein
MSYHHDVGRWSVGRQYCYLESVDKGQEFVINPSGRPGVMSWVRRLFNDVADQAIEPEQNQLVSHAQRLDAETNASRPINSAVGTLIE